MAGPEMELLKTSILEDGWTQPIVINDDFTIVDGFHRWTISADPEVSLLTGGLVPTVMLLNKDASDKRMATIRHNRARGTHGVLEMSDIVADMVTEGLSDKEIMRRLQMGREEVSRLKDQAGVVDGIEGGFTEI